MGLSTFELSVAFSLTLFATFAIRLVQHRSEWRKHRYPGPPHDFLWGHLKVMDEFRRKSMTVPNAHPHSWAIPLSREYGRLVFMDLWPFSTPLILVSDPVLADKLVRGDNLPKSQPELADDYPILGDQSLFLAKTDEHWKPVREAFAPGFRKSYIERHWISEMVTQVKYMCERMEKRALDGQPFEMANYLTDATCDVILHIVLGVHDVSLRNRILKVLDAQLKNASTANHVLPILDTLNPVRRFGEWRRGRQMDAILSPIIDARVAAKEAGTLDGKDIISHALSEHSLTRESLISQMKTFIFAGHDTTSVTLAWAYYHLTQNPGIVDRMREEHNAVFGPVLGEEMQKIVDDPRCLNELKFTNAVLRETLRLHPPAGGARRSAGGYWVQDPQSSTVYPVNETFFFYICHACMHTHPENWENPDVFDPDRWLDAQGELIQTPLKFQPFSKGPKNCIGLELALLEQKILLAMTIRPFNYQYASSETPCDIYRLTTRPHNNIPLIVTKAS